MIQAERFEKMLKENANMIESASRKYKLFSNTPTFVSHEDIKQDAQILLWEVSNNPDIENPINYFHHACSNIQRGIWKKETCNGKHEFIPLENDHIEKSVDNTFVEDVEERLDIERILDEKRVSELARKVVELVIEPPESLAQMHHLRVLRNEHLRVKLKLKNRKPKAGVFENIRVISRFLNVPVEEVKNAFVELRKLFVSQVYPSEKERSAIYITLSKVAE